MTFWQNLLVYVVLTCQMVCPILYLVWLWRRTGSWRVLTRGVLVIVPVASFLIGGGILALDTAFRVFALGIGLNGEDVEMTNWQYVRMTFMVCGIYGVMFSGMGLMLSLPIIAAWRLIHRKSFDHVVRYRARLGTE